MNSLEGVGEALWVESMAYNDDWTPGQRDVVAPGKTIRRVHALVWRAGSSYYGIRRGSYGHYEQDSVSGNDHGQSRCRESQRARAQWRQKMLEVGCTLRSKGLQEQTRTRYTENKRTC